MTTADAELSYDEARARVAAMTPAEMADVVESVVDRWSPLQKAALSGVLDAARTAIAAGEGPRAAALRLCADETAVTDAGPFEPTRDDYLADIYAAIGRVLELPETVDPLDVRAEPRRRSARSTRPITVRCVDGDPVEFHERPDRRHSHYVVDRVLERWIEETRWPFLSAPPLAGDRARCWRVSARRSSDPHLPAAEYVLRMRSGPGVWDLRSPGAQP